MKREVLARELVAIAKLLMATPSGSSKEYFLLEGVGKSKYVVNYHDGVKTHKDGSEFYDIKIFKSRPDAEAFMNELSRKGYKPGKRPIYK